MEVEKALFDGQVQGVIAVFYENERPLRGLAGVLDWRFHGVLSQFILAGAMSGKKGECAYLPISRNGSTFHLLLAGAGQNSSPGARPHIPQEALQYLHRNLRSLGALRVGVSRSDFGSVKDDYFAKHFKGVSLWIGN